MPFGGGAFTDLHYFDRDKFGGVVSPMPFGGGAFTDSLKRAREITTA